MRVRSTCMEPLPEEMKTQSVRFVKSQLLGGKDSNVCSYKQMEIPKSPNHAMEFLSRSWSPSASDFLHVFSSNNLLLSRDTKEQDDRSLTSGGSTNTAVIQQDNIKMDFKHPKTWLRGKSWTTLLRSPKEQKKEEKRLHTAQLHAALSLTQLAAAIAGTASSVGKQESSPFQNGRTEVPSQDMGDVLSSAAALLTNVCAETAESLGAHKAQVRTAVESGMAIQSPIDMIAVTATAATCLRGVSLLKSRAMEDPFSRIQEMLKISAEICTIMPSGRKECTRVSVYLKHDHLVFCFRKKYFGGALTSAKEYQITNISEERTEHQGNSLLCLKTKNGIIKLVFEDEMQSKIWISTILNLLEMRNPSRQRQAIHTD
ncbi:VAN3-binding protein-like isoform X2 [Sesamum indicum]|nr:VAN3-binding protein-like isoform X2 [Sesamum indicum]